MRAIRLARARRGAALGLLLAAVLAPVPGHAESVPPVSERLAEHAGDVVVLNFWAAWCAPCREELPLLAGLEARYRDRGVVFVGASTDAEEDRAKAEEMLEEAGVTYPIWYGLSDADMEPLGLGEAIPVTAVFDRDGTRAFRLIGEVDEKSMVERLEWLLGPRDREPPDELRLPPGLSRKPYEGR